MKRTPQHELFARVWRTERVELDRDYLAREFAGMAHLAAQGEYGFITAEQALDVIARRLGFDFELDEADLTRRIREQGANVIDMFAWLQCRAREFTRSVLLSLLGWLETGTPAPHHGAHPEHVQVFRVSACA